MLRFSALRRWIATPQAAPQDDECQFQRRAAFTNAETVSSPPAYKDAYQMVLSRKPLENSIVEQSDRLLRMARVVAAAEATFGSAEKASVWLRRRTAALGGRRPLQLLDTDAGAVQVLDLLGRIDHGLTA